MPPQLPKEVHQTIGECYVEEVDITRLSRFKYLCLTDYDEDFDFSCVEALPDEGAVWYTACGRAHSNAVLYKGAVTSLSALGLGLYLFLLGGLRRRLPSD